MSKRARWKRGGGCRCSFCLHATWGRKPATIERVAVAEGLGDVTVNACDAGTCDDCADAVPGVFSVGEMTTVHEAEIDGVPAFVIEGDDGELHQI